MSSQLISALHSEERAIIAELRASKLFQRLEGIQRLLGMYDAQPSVSISLDLSPAVAPEAERAAAAVVHLAPPVAATASQAIPMPGPVAAAAEAAVAEAARAQGTMGTGPTGEGTGVVSSVRAALLGIGKV